MSKQKKQTWHLHWNSTQNAVFERLIQRYKEKTGYLKLMNAISDLPVGDRVLEVGAGKGMISRQLNNKGWRSFAIDREFDVAYQNQYCLNHKYAVGDMFTLPFKAESFDMVISCGLLEHFDAETLGRILREMKRVGKTVVAWLPTCGIEWRTLWWLRNLAGGNVYSEAYVHTPDDLEKIFQNVGFDKITSDVIFFSGFLRYICICGSNRERL